VNTALRVALTAWLLLVVLTCLFFMGANR